MSYCLAYWSFSLLSIRVFLSLFISLLKHVAPNWTQYSHWGFVGLFYVAWKLHSFLHIPRWYLLSCNSVTLQTNALLVCWNNIFTLFYKAAPVPHLLLMHFIILAFDPKCTAVNLSLIVFILFFFSSIIFSILQDDSILTHSLPYPQQPTPRVWFPKQFCRSA